MEKCIVRKVYIPSVKLAVPQEVYDKLGLRPNQTILISNSQTSQRPGTSEDNMSVLNSSDKTSVINTNLQSPNLGEKALLSQPESNGNTTYGKAGSSAQKHSGMVLALANAESGKEITTQNFKPVCPLNSQTTVVHHGNAKEGNTPGSTSGGTGDVNASTEMNETSRKRSEPESSNASQRKRRGRYEKRETLKVSYPRTCLKCDRTYSCPGSYQNHKKNCAEYASFKNCAYSRTCTNCNKLFENKVSFSVHRKRCDDIRRKAGYLKTSSTLRCEHGHELHKAIPEASNAETAQEMYTTNCSICSFQSIAKISVSDVKCAENEKREISYPRTCTVCNKSFPSMSSFSDHERNACKVLKRPKEIQESSSRGSREINDCSKDGTDTISCDSQGVANVSQAVNGEEKSSKYIPVTIDFGQPKTLFFVKKTL